VLVPADLVGPGSAPLSILLSERQIDHFRYG
jgi:hypothetical protein